MLQRGHSGDGCDLASTLCKYNLRMGDAFVLSLARVQRVGGSISSELLMCYCVLWIDHRDNRCMYKAHFCFMSVVVTVWGSVDIFACCVAGVVKDSVFLALEFCMFV